MGIAFAPGSEFTRIVELTPALRKRVEATIEHLVALLDAYDGEADSEPNLGWPERFGRGAVESDPGDDREDESDFEPEEGDDDHGWTEDVCQLQQGRFNASHL